MRFGVHEIALHGEEPREGNPFDTVATVAFVPPSGSAAMKTVEAFYDGDGWWRARVFVSEAGEWRWRVQSSTTPTLDGRSGSFRAADSALPGRLVVHPRNPRQWMREDGRWFLNLNDSAYYLLSPRDGRGQPVSDEDFRAYVDADVAHGITSLRAWVATDSSGVRPGEAARIIEWNAMFGDSAHEQLRIDLFQCADRRLAWLLDRHPTVYLQLIILPNGPWRADESFWAGLALEQRTRLLRHLVARYAAFPQIFWLITNDTHYGRDRLARGNADVESAKAIEAYPHNAALAREVGGYLRRHDPWRHPISTGHARTVEWAFGDESWADYLHLEELHDLGARACTTHWATGKPIFLGEDRYERDRPGTAPEDMRYFQRRLFWSWLLAGGSANYGGYWWTVLPYDHTNRRGATVVEQGRAHEYRGALRGLDSVRVIHDYFEETRIELADFVPAPALVRDPADAIEARAPKCMQRGSEEFLIYHPNAAADGREARVHPDRAAALVLDLRAAPGAFTVEWLRALDGARVAGPDIAGGQSVELRAPWSGADVVLRLRRRDPH